MAVCPTAKAQAEVLGTKTASALAISRLLLGNRGACQRRINVTTSCGVTSMPEPLSAACKDAEHCKREQAEAVLVMGIWYGCLLTALCSTPLNLNQMRWPPWWSRIKACARPASALHVYVGSEFCCGQDPTLAAQAAPP